jgi:hypothetical protein
MTEIRGCDMLITIKNYLREKGAASLSEIIHHCESNAAAVEGALEQWVRRGHVRKVKAGGHCKGCSSLCSDSDALKVYEWVED